MNQPVSVGRSATQQASFDYDPQNQRYRKSISGSITYSLGDGYERDGNATGGTHRHELGPVVVTRQPASSSTDGVAQNLYYTLRDRLGSTLAVVDDLNMAASQIDHRDYDAYGRVRGPSLATLPFLTGLNLSPQTTHGFTNQDHVDSVKLIHMGGRVYDYTLGRLPFDPCGRRRSLAR